MSEIDPDPTENRRASTGPLPRAHRLLCLVLAAFFLGGLVYLLAAGSGSGPAYVLVPLTGLALLTALLARRLLVRHWIWIAAGFMGLALLLMLLVTDEPAIRHPLTLDKISPIQPGDTISHEVLMRLRGLDDQTLGMANRRIFQGLGPNMSVDAGDTVKFRNFLVGQRAAIDADWDNLGPVRDWWGELATFDRLGDTSPGQPSDPNIPFGPFRAYFQTAAAAAGLEALDGGGDAAFAILQPALEVSRKLAPASRSLVRSMMSVVAQHQLIDTANFVLDETAVSPEAKARFAAALAPGIGGTLGAQHMIAVESARIVYVLEDPLRRAPGIFFPPGSWQGSVAAAVGPVLYNPQRTVNAYLEWSDQMRDLAARREGTKMDAITEAWIKKNAAPGVRNIAGGFLLKDAVPAFGKVVDSYWKMEDKRAALIKRLQAPPQPSTPAPPSP